MRTKTLLIAAAALAVGVLTSSAQTYSQNIVGYVTMPLRSGGGFTMLVNPLTNTTANAETVMGSCLDAGDQISLWAGHSYNTFTYQGGPNGYLTPPDDWVDSNGNNVAAPNLLPGQGYFYATGSGDTETNTFTGSVVLTNSTIMNPGGGFTLVGSTPPISVSVESTNMSLPLDAGDQVSIWLGNGYATYTYQGGANGYLTPPNDWVDSNGNNVAAPVVNVGQGFFYATGSGDSETWIQNLIVQ
jgi:hypothetical protein